MHENQYMKIVKLLTLSAASHIEKLSALILLKFCFKYFIFIKWFIWDYHLEYFFSKRERLLHCLLKFRRRRSLPSWEIMYKWILKNISDTRLSVTPRIRGERVVGAIALRSWMLRESLTSRRVIATRSANVRTCVPPGNRWFPSIMEAARVLGQVGSRPSCVAHARTHTHAEFPRLVATAFLPPVLFYLFDRDITWRHIYLLFHSAPRDWNFHARKDHMNVTNAPNSAWANSKGSCTRSYLMKLHNVSVPNF